MTRYIDADALIKKIFPYDVADKKQYAINAYAIYKAISEAPTVDIVPKSEVERLSKELDNLAREIFEEIEKCKVVMGFPAKIITFRYSSSKRGFEEYVIEGDVVAFSDIAELKKKYTEGKQ